MTRKTIILTVAVFILALLARIYWFEHKVGLHTDEAMTIVISQDNQYGFIKYYPENQVIKGKTLKQITFSADNSIKTIVKDLKKLRFHNNGDTPNTSFYFSLFRISQLNSDSSDLQNTLVRGFCLNLILFTLSFFFMFKLLNLLDFDKKYIPFILLIAYLNTGSISISIFMRYYAVQEMAFVMTAWAFLSILKAKDLKQIPTLIKLSTTGALSLLSGYFGIFYTGILGLILLIKKQNRLLIATGILVGIALTFLVYPTYLDFLTVKNNWLYETPLTENLLMSFNLLSLIVSTTILSNYLLYPIILVILGITLIKTRKINSDKNILTLIGINSILYVVFLIFAPAKILRYVEPLFPILSLIIPVIVLETKKNLRKILVISLSTIYIFCAIVPSLFESYDSEINQPQVSIKGGVIENTFQNTNCKPIQNSNVPIIISEKRGWNVLNVIPYLKDEQDVIFNLNDNLDIKYDKQILLVAEKSAIIPNNLKIKQTFSCQRFTGYELIKD